MSKKYLKSSDITPKLLKKITEMAADCASQHVIAGCLGFSTHRFQETSVIREAWLNGHTQLKADVLKSYAELVKSGECWAAMKHFLAINCDMVEPKEPSNQESSQPTKISLEFINNSGVEVKLKENDKVELKEDNKL